MKVKQLLFGGLLFAAFSTFALQSKAQSAFGINAGANFANITGKDAPDGNKIKTGFQAGLTYDIGIADDFVIQPGISYVQNGAKNNMTVGGDSKTYLNYIQVPLTFQYQPELGNGRLLLGVGPYVGYGVGQVKVENSSASVKLDWDGDAALDLNLNKVDAGGKLLVGYQVSNGISLNLNANMGLTNLSKANNIKMNNTSFGLTLGYKF